MTFEQAMESIAASLREFGYPDVTARMVEEIYGAYAAGRRGDALPHGVIGRFVEGQIDEVAEQLKALQRRSKK